MGFEPQKFFIGMLDFFSILLPGMIVTYVLRGDAGTRVLGDAYPELEGGESVAFFLVLSYLLGHFVFLLGAALLDRYAYDPLRNATPGGQKRRKREIEEEQEKKKSGEATDEDETRCIPWLKEREKKPAWKWVICVSRLVVGKAVMDDRALERAIVLKNEQLGDAEASINAFQWCKARLLFDKPDALAKVERFEADSKFFRSLVVLFAVLALAFLGFQEWRLSLLAFFLLVMAFWRYVDQRLKSTTHAYWFLLTLEADRPAGSKPGSGADG